MGHGKELVSVRYSLRRKGCQRSPIFEFVPIDHVVIDSLHLFLRVAAWLTNQPLHPRQDGITKATGDHSNVTAYEKFLNDVCKIHFRWYTSKETKQLQWRDLPGPEKVRLFSNVDHPKHFPEVPNGSIIQDKNFGIFSRNLERYRCESKWASSWYQKLGSTVSLAVPNEKYNTLCTLVRLSRTRVHGKDSTIHKFTQQGLEKLNDLTTQHYLRSTNHHNVDAFKQVMEKWNRLEQLTDGGYRRTSRPQHCGICGLTTHTKLYFKKNAHKNWVVWTKLVTGSVPYKKLVFLLTKIGW